MWFGGVIPFHSHFTRLGMKNLIAICYAFFWILISVAHGQTLLAQSYRSDSLRQRLLSDDREHVFIVAHRADWRNAPENSIEAIESAIAMGVDMIEIDVQKTKDGQLVLMHDKSLNRTTDGLGLIEEWTLDSIKTLYLKNGQGRVTPFKIPTLKEALLACKGRVLINLDKSYGYFDEVYEILLETGTLDQVVMKANKPYREVKKEFGRYLDKVLFMPIIDLKSKDAVKRIKEYLANTNPVAFELVFDDDELLTHLVIELISSSDSRIWINSLWSNLNGGHDDDLAISDLSDSYGWILDQSTTMIQTDRPLLLLAYLNNR